MKIGLIDLDNTGKFPNLALMKISAYHRKDMKLNGISHYLQRIMTKFMSAKFLLGVRTILMQYRQKK